MIEVQTRPALSRHVAHGDSGTCSASGTAASPSADPSCLRAAFVNSGMLGHRSVARLLAECTALMPDVHAVHVDLSADLTLFDRAVRRALSMALAPANGAMANLDLRRWRQELNVGLLAARRLAAADLHGRVDLLHFHTQASAYASLARMRMTPSIVSIDATQTLAQAEAGSSLAQLSFAPSIEHDRVVFRAAAAITATSEWAARDLAALYPDCAGKVHVMPYPVRGFGEEAWITERFARASRAKPRALFVGGDFPRKGGADLLAAWADAELGAIATLDLVTDWPVAVDSLPPGVSLRRGVTAYTPEWTALWRAADLFVMPSRHEAFGMVYQEAAAAGLPVVATRVNAVPEIVHDGVTGLLVARGDLEALAAAIRHLAASAEERRRMGTEALARIRRVASLDRYSARLHDLMTGAVLDRGVHHV